MNQLCQVCGEAAAGFHFGAFTCEGCKSFFGRTHTNLSTINECKNSGQCVINKKNRTACKACRLKKCRLVGMSKNASRYGRRSNWFKIHCLLQEQQQNESSLSIPHSTMPTFCSSSSRSTKNLDSDSSSSSTELDKDAQFLNWSGLLGTAISLSDNDELRFSIRGNDEEEKFDSTKYFRFLSPMWTYRFQNGLDRENCKINYLSKCDFVPEQNEPIDLSKSSDKNNCTFPVI